LKEDIYISLGSNQGNRIKTIREAVDAINSFATIQARSAVYETPPWGFDSDQAFLNAVIQINCNLPPEKLLQQLFKVEKEYGRFRSREKSGYSDRPLDLDILIYGNRVITQKNLKIPHPRMKERKFVLAPLSDMAPDLVPPGEIKTIGQLLSAIEDQSPIVKTDLKL